MRRFERTDGVINDSAHPARCGGEIAAARERLFPLGKSAVTVMLTFELACRESEILLFLYRWQPRDRRRRLLATALPVKNRRYMYR